MCVLSIKVPIRKKSGNLFNDPRIYIYIYILFVRELLILFLNKLLELFCLHTDGFMNSFLIQIILSHIKHLFSHS